MLTDQRHPLGVTDAPEPRSARQAVKQMLDAGLLDEVMDRVDAGSLTLTGEGGFLPEMVKAVLERGLQAELTEHLGYERGDPAGRGSPNSRNGTTPKTLATEVGAVPLNVPRHPAGSFEPRLVPKEQGRARRHGRASRARRDERVLVSRGWTPAAGAFPWGGAG